MPLWILNRRSVANLPKPTVLQREGKRLTRYWAVEKSEPLNQNVVFGRLMRQRKEQNCVLISNSVPIFWINFSLSFSLSGALSALNSFPLPPPNFSLYFSSDLWATQSEVEIEVTSLASSSVTTWPDYFFNIWPFSPTKICQSSVKIQPNHM